MSDSKLSYMLKRHLPAEKGFKEVRKTSKNFNIMHSGAFGDFGMSKETLKGHKNSSYARQSRMRNPSPVATWRFVPSVVWPMGAMHSYLLPRDRFSKDLTDRFLSKHYAEMRFKSSQNHHILFWGSI